MLGSRSTLLRSLAPQLRLCQVRFITVISTVPVRSRAVPSDFTGSDKLLCLEILATISQLLRLLRCYSRWAVKSNYFFVFRFVYALRFSSALPQAAR